SIGSMPSRRSLRACSAFSRASARLTVWTEPRPIYRSAPALLLKRNTQLRLSPCRPFETCSHRPPPSASRGTDHLNFEITDLLAQGIAVDAERIGRTDLVAPGRGKGGRKQRIFHFPKNAVVEPGRRQ